MNGHRSGFVFGSELGDKGNIFAYPHAERSHERTWSCGKCGQPFTQYRLSDIFIAAAARCGKALQQVFGHSPWSPLFCGACESKELDHEYRQDPHHDLPTRTTFVRPAKITAKVIPIQRTSEEW